MTSTTRENADIVDRLRDPEFAGPMRHLQDWYEIDTIMANAATEIASLRRELAELREDKRIVDELLDAAVEQRDEARSENATLREIISESAAAIGNGAAIAPQCSVEFMQGLPREIALCTSRLTAPLQWIIDNPGAHPMNMWRVAQDGLRKLAGEKADG
jgi:hypothetical protein